MHERWQALNGIMTGFAESEKLAHHYQKASGMQAKRALKRALFHAKETYY